MPFRGESCQGGGSIAGSRLSQHFRDRKEEVGAKGVLGGGCKLRDAGAIPVAEEGKKFDIRQEKRKLCFPLRGRKGKESRGRGELS